MTRILWLRVIADPAKSSRLFHLRHFVLHELRGVENCILAGRAFESPVPAHNKIVKLPGRSRAKRKKMMTLWGVLPRPLPFIASLHLQTPLRLLVGRYDLVYTYMLSSAPTIFTYFIGHLIRGKPYIVMTEHWYARRSRWVNWWYRVVTRSARLLVAQSTKSESYLLEELGVRPERLVKCVNTVGNLEAEAYDARVARNLDADAAHKVLCVARFVEFKGQDILIRAFRRIDRGNVQLYLVGANSNTYGNHCRDLAEGDSRIHFCGPLSFEEVLSYYRRCDIFVLANRFTADPVEGAESFGYAPLEAALLGLPIIVTTATGCADDLVVPDVTGFQVKEGDPDALFRTLMALLDDPARISQMGGAAQKRARALCSKSAVSGLGARLQAIVTRPDSRR